jgi:hypothetical protein
MVLPRSSALSLDSQYVVPQRQMAAPMYAPPPPQTYLPELLARILAADSLQDLCAAGVLLDKGVHLVHVAVDDDVQAVFDRRVLGDLLGSKRFGHGGDASGSGIVR